MDLLTSILGIILGILMIMVAAQVLHYMIMSGKFFHNLDRGDKTPLNILKERYAKGEINKEEFEEKKKDLTD